MQEPEKQRPRLWKLYNDSRGYKIYRENGPTIIYHSKRSNEKITPVYEDAALIVRAVNSFDAMREALEGVVRELRPVGNVKEIYHQLVAYEAAKAALALAKGEVRT